MASLESTLKANAPVVIAGAAALGYALGSGLVRIPSLRAPAPAPAEPATIRPGARSSAPSTSSPSMPVDDAPPVDSLTALYE